MYVSEGGRRRRRGRRGHLAGRLHHIATKTTEFLALFEYLTWQIVKIKSNILNMKNRKNHKHISTHI